MAESRRRNNPKPREPQEFDQSIVEVARVTRVTKGGKQMRFRACIVLGDRKGRVASGVGKGIDVAQAISKATARGKKDMLHLSFRGDTIPFPVEERYGAAHIILKAAPSGTGIKAGGPMRIILELAGVPNVVGKMLGSKNKINNIRATLAALERFVIKKEIPLPPTPSVVGSV